MAMQISLLARVLVHLVGRHHRGIQRRFAVARLRDERLKPSR